MKMLVAGTDCERCKHSAILRIISKQYITPVDKCYCMYRNKEYFYGQYVDCEDREER